MLNKEYTQCKCCVFCNVSNSQGGLYWFLEVARRRNMSRAETKPSWMLHRRSERRLLLSCGPQLPSSSSSPSWPALPRSGRVETGGGRTGRMQVRGDALTAWLLSWAANIMVAQCVVNDAECIAVRRSFYKRKNKAPKLPKWRCACVKLISTPMDKIKMLPDCSQWSYRQFY